MPVWLAIPIAAIMTAFVGLIFGIPAARVKGLYLAIATLAAQFIMEDFSQEQLGLLEEGWSIRRTTKNL